MSPISLGPNRIGHFDGAIDVYSACRLELRLARTVGDEQRDHLGRYADAELGHLLRRRGEHRVIAAQLGEPESDSRPGELHPGCYGSLVAGDEVGLRAAPIASVKRGTGAKHARPDPGDGVVEPRERAGVAFAVRGARADQREAAEQVLVLDANARDAEQQRSRQALEVLAQRNLVGGLAGVKRDLDTAGRFDAISGRDRVTNGQHKIAALWRQLRALGAPALLLAAACAVVVVMFATNTDMGGDPHAVRGDGKYRPVLARGDGHMLYLMARSTALDGDWRFDNDLARFGDPWNEPRTKTGRKSIVHPIGPALVWTPLIWIAQGGAVVVNAFGADVPLHGYTSWHQRFVFLSSALFACGAVLLGWRFARRLLGGRWAATYAAVAVLLGTSLTYYATYMPSYSHAMDAFTCAAFLAYWIATLGSTRLRRWLVLGVLLGIAMLVRVQALAFGIVLVVEVVAQLARRQTRSGGAWLATARTWVGGGCITLVTALIVFTPQLLEWHIVFGRITELPQGAKYTRFEAPMIAELLWSARNGWFTTTPLAYAGVVGLFLLPRQARVVAVGLIAAVAIQVYLNSTIVDWWGSASFGQRRLCSVTFALVIGLAALLWRAGRLIGARPRARRFAHAAAIAVLGVFVAWNLSSVYRLRGGQAAPSERTASCCGRFPPFARGAAQWLYDRIGNPFQFPANAVFALLHDVPLARWDQTVGDYPLVPPFGAFRDNKLVGQRGVWRVGSPHRASWLVGGWSAPQSDDRPFRYLTASEATVLVPNLMPEPQRYEVWMRASAETDVALLWNEDRVASARLTTTWTAVTFELRAPALHTNELTVRKLAASDARVDVADIEVELR